MGGAITVPATTFTTQSNTAPVYNLNQLVFTFPDEQGWVTLNGPPGTLAPGSTILVVNESTGEVSTLGVNNDGSVSDVGGQLVAHVADRLIVTITDLLGRTTTFKRSEYVAPDGTTAVGNGGGEVQAPGGVEVRIPEDAVMNGVAAILKIAALLPQDLPPGFLPEIADATLGTILKIESPDPPAFDKEVDLAFPKPADAPEDATYFIYRRMTGPHGQMAYEALDYADVEGEGADAKVVTSSYPFSGYRQSVNGYSLSGIDHSGAIGSQFENYAILMWAFDDALPGRALGGAITGRVLRVTQAPGSTTPTYVAVAGAIVSGVDVQGQPLFGQSSAASPVTFAVSQADGTYSLFDRQYTGGAVTISATLDGVTRTATAYEAHPQDAKSPGLAFARNVAYANITFPVAGPTVPPSPVQVSVMTLDAEGQRKLTTGIVVAGEPLVLGVKAAGMTVQRMDVVSGSQTQEYGVRVDPLAGQDPLAADVIADGSVTFALPGSYTVTATAVGAFAGAVTGHVVVRAVAPGGSNNDALPNDPPSVITARTTPKGDARGVPIGVLPQVVFTEPVKNLPGNVTLTDAAGQSVGISLSGVGPNGPVADLTPTSVVTSVTIQPMAGLTYNTVYTLSLSSGIEDTDRDATDQPAPKPLAAYTTSFTTFAPEAIGRTTDTFTAGGMAVIGDRAYVAGSQNLGRKYTHLRLFDVSDPTTPQEIVGATTGGQLLAPPPAKA